MMKKPYVKPGMYLESFALSQSIAANCGAADHPEFGAPGYGSKKTCGWDTGTGQVIWLEKGVCKDVRPDKPIGGVCYNNPNSGAAIFSRS